jgi:kynureninase
MVCIEPEDPSNPILSTEHILSVIDQHAAQTALILLPGIQFYTGQLFSIPTITAHAHSHSIPIGWDLAHAMGNVPLALHEWNVDFAAWCSYKYLNAGPGCIAGLFVHSSHSNRESLSGWWGNNKTTRFKMTNEFDPIPGAAGWQLSNPSALDITALNASLEVFHLTDMSALRDKSLRLTAYLEELLDALPPHFSIITPRDPAQRGAQLSLKLLPGLLDVVMEELESNGVVIDERRPDVIRVAPAPLYNTFEDVWTFVNVFGRALETALAAQQGKIEASGSNELEMTS